MNLTTGYTNPIFEMIGYEPKTTERKNHGKTTLNL